MKFLFKKKTSNRKQYVIGDIHGCILTFKALLKKIDLSKEDELYLLGDYIDRGPDSKAVIDHIISLKQNGYRIFPLRGNHEEDFLFYLSSESRRRAYGRHYPNNNIFDKRYINFLNKLPYYYNLQGHLLVHAGFNFAIKDIFSDREAMIWIRDWEDEYDAKIAKNKVVVHGHSPSSFDEITDAIKTRKKVIPLDNGCVYPSNPELGNLLCLELNSYKLESQKCIDFVFVVK